MSLLKQHEIIAIMRHFIRFYEFLLQASCFENIDPTGGKFIAPIEPIAGTSDWIAISDRAGLVAMANNLSGKYYLTADIDLSGAEWVSIGDETNPFIGILDGQGYVIVNRTIGVPEPPKDIQYAGLFGYVNGTTMKNIGLKGTYINVSSFYSYAGGICGSISFSIMSNCYWNNDSTQTVNGSVQNPKKGVGIGTDGATPLTSGKMNIQESFVGFDFDTICKFQEDVNNGYPILKAFNYPIEDEPTSMALNKSETTIQVGDTETLIVTIDSDNIASKVAVWSSRDRSVATVDRTGKVTAVAEGESKD